MMLHMDLMVQHNVFLHATREMVATCLLQVNIPYAKSVCVSGCPKEDSVCNATGLPCTTGNLYRYGSDLISQNDVHIRWNARRRVCFCIIACRCAYYRFAGDSVYGQSTNVQVRCWAACKHALC
jgi:hypothetical protein